MSYRGDTTDVTALVKYAKSLEIQIDVLVKALEAVVRDVNEYERVNNLAPTPGHIECWDSIALAKQVLGAVGGEQ